MRHLFGYSIFALLLDLIYFPVVGHAQFQHTYPRKAIFHFGSATPEWYAKFDLVMISTQGAGDAEKIHKVNPKTIVLSTSEWCAMPTNKSFIFPEGTDPNWLARDSQGNPILLSGSTKLLNITNYCPIYNGMRFNEALPKFIVPRIDFNYFDGIATDWLWRKPHISNKDIDLDNNGKNDYVEHGENWVNNVWSAGVETILANARKLIPVNKLLLANAGLFQDYGWDKINGLIMEHVTGMYGWDGFVRRTNSWLDKKLQPGIPIIDARADGRDPLKPSSSKQYYRLMRFLLCSALLGDFYFSFAEPEAGEHHYTFFYDEYELNLGFPKGKSIEMSNGCYVRFFDRGVSLVNPTGLPVTVTDSDLGQLQYYDGPYYRFRGNQDQAVNNGMRFDELHLLGEKQENNRKIIGDGIILLKSVQTIVTDIVIDNLSYGTTPGQPSAKFSGNWQQTSDGSDAFYKINRASKGWYQHAFSYGGSGENTVTYAPNINIGGKFRIYEWHGKVPFGSAADNVKFKITHSKGVNSEIAVNQALNVGKWNELGVYEYDGIDDLVITVSNDADGIVIADAIRYEYLSDGSLIDRQKPNIPQNIKIQIK